MNWFENIWLWFVENKDAIIAWATSASTVGFITALITLIRQHKSIKANTASTEQLSTTMKECKELEVKVAEVQEEVKGIKEALDTVAMKLADNTDVLDNYNSKLDAIIEVQHIAYSTVKDQTIRESINNIILNSKYKEQGTRAELLHEIEHLKQAAADVTTKYQTLIEESSKKVEEVAKVVEKPQKAKQSISRY